ncbi:MAG: VCBS repeat-containing protein, partial [Bacteroidales bacterium]|nr:VCBS repeat-containing protein [Bacteroidales bacterium]
NRTSAIYVNDGSGNFTYNNLLLGNTEGVFTCELFDVDNDGYLDLIWGGDSEYTQAGITWGNGESFNNASFTPFPKTLAGCELYLDFEFCDLNNDGTYEIVANSTSNGKVYPLYDNWGMNVIECKNRVCKDVTFLYFEKDKNMGFERIYAPYTWIVWIDLEEIEGRTYLVGRKGNNGDIYYELINGKFIRDNNIVTNITNLVYTNGISLYSDYLKTDGDFLEGICTDTAYSGDACIKFSNWSHWNGCNINMHPYMDNGADISYLLENEYGLEFYIKNLEPTLTFDIKLESVNINSSGEPATFWYYYDAQKHLSKVGEWERIYIPLKQFYKEERISNEYFKSINHLNFITTSEGGKDFYLDEIRIRKAL